MKIINLTGIITHSLNLKKKDTINFVSSLVELILRGEIIKSYNLAKSAAGFISNKLDAKAKRIRTLLSGGKLEDYVSYAKYIMKLFGIVDNLILAMDRNWERGNKK